MSARSLGINRRLLLVVSIVVASLLAVWLWSYSNTDPKPEVVTGEAVTIRGIVTKPTPGVYEVMKDRLSSSVSLLNGNDSRLQAILEPLLKQSVTLYGYRPIPDSGNLFVLWVNGVDLTKLDAPTETGADDKFEALLQAFTETQQTCINEGIGADRVSQLLSQPSAILTIDDFKTIEDCVAEHPVLPDAAESGGDDV